MYGLLSIKNEGFESLKKVIKIDSVKEQGYCVTWSSCIYTCSAYNEHHSDCFPKVLKILVILVKVNVKLNVVYSMCFRLKKLVNNVIPPLKRMFFACWM